MINFETTKAIEAEDVELFFYVIIRMLSEIPELTTGKLPIIKTIVASIDPQQVDLLITYNTH
jgi:hypothetical protein